MISVGVKKHTFLHNFLSIFGKKVDRSDIWRRTHPIWAWQKRFAFLLRFGNQIIGLVGI
jgi:hypothetical protein